MNEDEWSWIGVQAGGEPGAIVGRILSKSITNLTFCALSVHRECCFLSTFGAFVGHLPSHLQPTSSNNPPRWREGRGVSTHEFNGTVS